MHIGKLNTIQIRRYPPKNPWLPKSSKVHGIHTPEISNLPACAWLLEKAKNHRRLGPVNYGFVETLCKTLVPKGTLGLLGRCELHHCSHTQSIRPIILTMTSSRPEFGNDPSNDEIVSNLNPDEASGIEDSGKLLLPQRSGVVEPWKVGNWFQELIQCCCSCFQRQMVKSNFVTRDDFRT